MPHLALQHKVLSKFCPVHREERRTYGPWSIVIGWLGMYFPQVQGSFYRKSANLLPSYPTWQQPKVERNDPSKLLWYRSQVSIQAYYFKDDLTQKTIKDEERSPWHCSLFWWRAAQASYIRPRLHIVAKIYSPTPSGHQLGYNQHIPGSINLSALGKVTLMDANTCVLY